MSTDALAHYENIIAERANELAERIAELKGPIDFTAWISYFTCVVSYT